MKSYVDITLLPDADIALYFLWEKVYQQIHLALVEAQGQNKKQPIGIAFPEYASDKFHLGNKLRVFAESEGDLATLNLPSWLARLSDYVHLTKVRDVPDKLDGYAIFKRLQLKSNNDRLARRKAKRDGIDLEAAHAYFENRKEVYSQAPFIRMKSLSSGKQFRLLITKEITNSSDASKGFSTYGLSSKSSVPLF